MDQLKNMIGHEVHHLDEFDDEFYSLFTGYGLTEAPIQEFYARVVHCDAKTHHGSHHDDRRHNTETDIAYCVRFHAEFKLPGDATFVAIGKMTPVTLTDFSVGGYHPTQNAEGWRHAMMKRLEVTDMLRRPVLHLVTYEQIKIVPKWLELERAVKAKFEDDHSRMDDTVVMTRFEKAVLRHKAAKYDNGGVAKAQDNQNARKRMRELETSVAELTSRAKAAEKERDALQARLDQANKKLVERADVRFKQDVREARADGRGDQVAIYAWAEEFNPERCGC